MRSIIIAAPHSGSGKTTVTIGIMECLKRRGLRIAPFKVGPDFIDPGYHRLVTDRPSVNLDGWMCSEAFLRESFFIHAQDADMAVIEGVMGLFDGISGVQDAGSTAQIARITGVPVILLVDAKGQARSAAALVKGFAEFDPQIKVAGVIFNNVASDNHGRVLKEAVESIGIGISVIGCIPRDEKLRIKSRHLGLLTVEENPLPAEYLDHLAEVVRGHVDLALLWASANPHLPEPLLPFEAEGHVSTSEKFVKYGDMTPKVRIAVARDAAFCFVYEDNLRLLREAGAELVAFSPLLDEELPGDIAGLYLPGGYPELFADTLAANGAMKAAIREAIEAGLPAFAECGGFIYLTRGMVETGPESDSAQGIRDQVLTCGGNAKYQDLIPFVGIFPVTIRMLPRRKALGYREIETVADSLIGPRGTIARGHEFHYSDMGEMPLQVKRLYRVRRQGVDLWDEGFSYKNCLASYMHLHFGSCPEIATAFVENCRNYQNN